MNLAVVVPGGMTATLQVTPLLRTLRAGEPAAHITLVCDGSATPVAQGIPPVDLIVGVTGLDTGGIRVAARLWWELRRRRLDAVLLCSAAAGCRWGAFLAGVPERFGTAGGMSAALLSGRATSKPGENRATVWLRLAGLVGIREELHAPAYEPGAEALREADRIIHTTGFADGRLLVALAPGAGHGGGRSGEGTSWDGERYALLANQLAQRHGAGIVFVGAADDRSNVERTSVDLRAPAIDLCGQLDLPVLAGVLSRCDLLVGGDSPLLHLAAAVGTPAVGLFGPTDGRERGPYGSDHRIIQAIAPHSQGNGHRAATADMDRIRVEDVLAGIEASL